MSPVAARVLSSLLEERTGQKLSIGRRWRIDTSLAPMLRELGIGTIDCLAAMLATQRDSRLARDVVDALLNNETYFFRDFLTFQTTLSRAVRELAAARPERRLRIWSAGCSTGQEAYSLAMLLAEPDPAGATRRVDILGTDISETAIRSAREGYYSQFEIQRGLPVRSMAKWFAPQGEGWRATAALRARVRFDVHNLLDPPPGRFDVILCRNVLLYFAGDTRAAVFDRLGQAIGDDGWLMLGAGETVIGRTERFQADAQHRGFYRPKPLTK